MLTDEARDFIKICVKNFSNLPQENLNYVAVCESYASVHAVIEALNIVLTNDGETLENSWGESIHEVLCGYLRQLLPEVALLARPVVPKVDMGLDVIVVEGEHAGKIGEYGDDYDYVRDEDVDTLAPVFFASPSGVALDDTEAVLIPFKYLRKFPMAPWLAEDYYQNDDY